MQALAERISVSSPDVMGAIRNALENLMDDYADGGRPFLAALVVRALEAGLPAPWFFRRGREPRIVRRRPDECGSLCLPCNGISQRDPLLCKPAT